MISFIKKSYRYAVLFTAVFTLLTVLIVLEAFVVPQVMTPTDEYPSNRPTSPAAPGDDITSEPTTDPTKTADNSPYSDSDKPTVTEMSYKDNKISVEIDTIRYLDTTCYIADIWIKDITCLKTEFARSTYGKNITEKTSNMARRLGAVIAVNGDYYGFRNTGFVVRNGILYRTEPRTGRMSEALTIYYDGTFEVVNEQTADCKTLFDNGAYQIMTFGPALMNKGELNVTPKTEVDAYKASNQRTGIGIYEPHHYCMIVSDGRTEESAGLTLYEFAELFDMLGCTEAYNLDGGGSSTMCFMGRVINVPTSDGIVIAERKVSDCVYIGY